MYLDFKIEDSLLLVIKGYLLVRNVFKVSSILEKVIFLDSLLQVNIRASQVHRAVTKESRLRILVGLHLEKRVSYRTPKRRLKMIKFLGRLVIWISELIGLSGLAKTHRSFSSLRNTIFLHVIICVCQIYLTLNLWKECPIIYLDWYLTINCGLWIWLLQFKAFYNIFPSYKLRDINKPFSKAFSLLVPRSFTVASEGDKDYLLFVGIHFLHKVKLRQVKEGLVGTCHVLAWT